MSLGRNTLDGQKLGDVIARIETAQKRAKVYQQEAAQALKDAKADGFNTSAIQMLLKMRKKSPGEQREAEDIRDLYMHAMGMGNEPPLFRYLEGLQRDGLGRDQVIEKLGAIVPAGATFTLEMGGVPVKLTRDLKGKLKVEDVEPPDETEQEVRKRRPKVTLPDAPGPEVTEQHAWQRGEEAGREGKPIVDNPFPFGDKRRSHWDGGWRKGAENDGMGPKE